MLILKAVASIWWMWWRTPPRHDDDRLSFISLRCVVQARNVGVVAGAAVRNRDALEMACAFALVSSEMLAICLDFATFMVGYHSCSAVVSFQSGWWSMSRGG